jgi:hypothetical protein
VAGFLLFYPAMRGIYRKIAILLALGALAVTGVARSAEARGGGAAAMAAAKAKLSRGAQIKLNRMKQKMALRTRGAQQQKSRRQLKLSKRKMMRAMSRRETGLRTSETDRVRSAFARDIDDPADHMQAPKASGSKNGVTQEELEVASLKQRKKMRLRAQRRARKDFKKLRRDRD